MNLQFSNYVNKQHPIMCEWQHKIKGMRNSGRERSSSRDKARKYKCTVRGTYSMGPNSSQSFPNILRLGGNNTICSKLITKYRRWVEYKPRFRGQGTRHARTHVGSPLAANFLSTLQPGASQWPNFAPSKK